MPTKPKSSAKPRSALKGPKQIECKVCGAPCYTGKRGMCDKHYNMAIAEKTKANAKKEKAQAKKVAARTKKANSLPKLVKKLDAVFSKFIRLRDSDSRGRASCICCGEQVEWEQLQCGHFMSRTAMNTRWDEQNCQGQSLKCNMFKQGNQYAFGLALDEKYGKGTANYLVTKSRELKKFTREELTELIELYSEKVENLLKSKNHE